MAPPLSHSGKQKDKCNDNYIITSPRTVQSSLSSSRLTSLGGHWKLAVSNLRTAVGNAKHHAKKRSRFTADQVGTEVIEVVNQLDAQALAVLHVLIGELVRLSRKGDH